MPASTSQRWARQLRSPDEYQRHAPQRMSALPMLRLFSYAPRDNDRRDANSRACYAFERCLARFYADGMRRVVRERCAHAGCADPEFRLRMPVFAAALRACV